MAEQTEWYHQLTISVEALRAQLGADERDFYFDRFMQVAKRVDSLAFDCNQCQEYQSLMASMVRELGTNVNQILKEQKLKFLGETESILSHMKKDHAFVSDGQYTATWLTIGLVFGLVFGMIIKQPAIAIPIGLALGLVIGLLFDLRARKAGKVI
ncbi:MAG: hypothetical protein FWH42_01685 [Dehalococcoidia bacterium]|nr:hypothetical protein [Dehalococcoidia bacterium]